MTFGRQTYTLRVRGNWRVKGDYEGGKTIKEARRKALEFLEEPEVESVGIGKFVERAFGITREDGWFKAREEITRGGANDGS